MCTITANMGGSSFIPIYQITNLKKKEKDTVLRKRNNNMRQKILPGDKKEVNW